jgi:hypothetical protein
MERTWREHEVQLKIQGERIKRRRKDERRERKEVMGVMGVMQVIGVIGGLKSSGRKEETKRKREEGWKSQKGIRFSVYQHQAPWPNRLLASFLVYEREKESSPGLCY